MPCNQAITRYCSQRLRNSHKIPKFPQYYSNVDNKYDKYRKTILHSLGFEPETSCIVPSLYRIIEHRTTPRILNSSLHPHSFELVTSGKWEFGNFENENSQRIPKAIVRYEFELIIRDLGIWEFGNDF